MKIVKSEDQTDTRCIDSATSHLEGIGLEGVDIQVKRLRIFSKNTDPPIFHLVNYFFHSELHLIAARFAG